ncbi:interferon-induced transmembrane protein 1-like [Chaetodon auriga]|uniref:interferon-induced transmembrane protein 1-like n=1 Tax=Chaetodon auriga TaxID=39042 RepID=UPI00403302CA
MAMNPAGHPAEAVPMQGRYDGLPGQPGAATVVQYTTVNITSEPPQDHIIWSLCCFVYSNPCCLGLAALIFSIKARDRKVAGDLNGARHYGSTARCLNIWATVLGSIMILISFIVIIVMSVQAHNAVNRYSSYNYNTRWRK